MDIDQILQEEIDFMTPMKEFLQSYPLLKPWEQLTVDYMQIDPQSPIGDSNAMAIAGMPRPSYNKDIPGTMILHQEINWIFTMRRWTNDNELRRDIGNFIANFNYWINKCQMLRRMGRYIPLLPSFGNNENEYIEAAGGMGMGSTVDPNVDEFQISIHIAFELELEREDY